jgi:hypothetical protein
MGIGSQADAVMLTVRDIGCHQDHKGNGTFPDIGNRKGKVGFGKKAIGKIPSLIFLVKTNAFC